MNSHKSVSCLLGGSVFLVALVAGTIIHWKFAYYRVWLSTTSPNEKYTVELTGDKGRGGFVLYAVVKYNILVNKELVTRDRLLHYGDAMDIVKLLDESSSLNNSAADKYEQAAALSGNDQQHRGMTSFASMHRKTVEANELLKFQMQMLSDETVVDEKMFNEKFAHSWQLIEQKRREIADDFEEGKRLLGW